MPSRSGKKAAVADAARFFSADQNVVVHHQIGDVFEADVALVQLASILRGDPVHHAGGVEGAHHVARPLLVLQQPFQQNAHALVRIDEAAVFRHRADAIGVAVGDQSSVAFFFHHRFLQQRDVRHDRFGIDAGEERVHFLPNRNVANAVGVEDARQNAAAGAVHRVDGEFEIGACV